MEERVSARVEVKSNGFCKVDAVDALQGAIYATHRARKRSRSSRDPLR